MGRDFPAIDSWIDESAWEVGSRGEWGKKSSDGHWHVLPFIAEAREQN